MEFVLKFILADTDLLIPTGLSND